jgi:PEP-CTERM motif
VIDFNGAVPNLIQLIATFNGDHSVAVDPISGEIFVPTGGVVAGSVCPLGCVLVFAQAAAVPEPASLTLMMTAFAGFAGLVWSRRRRQS